MTSAEFSRLRDEATAIWQAGVDAVRAPHLMRRAINREGDLLVVGGQRLPVADIERIAVVGAGKAGAGMAAGLEDALGDDLLKRVDGWVNVPADCVRKLNRIHLHAARPAGINEPTAEGVAGAERILEIVSRLETGDLCIVLISGGGSALLPAPVAGVSLEDKQQITRALSRAGATIGELNCVRKQFSRIKGGRLAAACTAGTMITLIISDVIGDPLDVIASGPTVADTTTPDDALAVLEKYADRIEVPATVRSHLETAPPSPGERTSVSNVVIGNIDIALSAAAVEAAQRGFHVESLGGANGGVARDVGASLAERCLELRDSTGRAVCLLSGGEPTVRVVPTDEPRSGGRNQELVLAATQRFWNEDMAGIALLSGGTDGEDGPTDAAGAFVDADIVELARSLALDPAEYLAINNSYAFFDQVGALLRTGPTQTNVMDLRVALVVAAE